MLDDWRSRCDARRLSAPATVRAGDPDAPLRSSAIDYDRGVPPGKLADEDDHGGMPWGDQTPRRPRATFSRDALRTLKLRETDRGNRLTIDQTAKRLEIARGATEVDREWLYGMLTERYA